MLVKVPSLEKAITLSQHFENKRPVCWPTLHQSTCYACLVSIINTTAMSTSSTTSCLSAPMQLSTHFWLIFDCLCLKRISVSALLPQPTTFLVWMPLKRSFFNHLHIATNRCCKSLCWLSLQHHRCLGCMDCFHHCLDTQSFSSNHPWLTTSPTSLPL